MPNASRNTGPGTQQDSIIGGGLAGILAATVFGGPVGAAIGLGTGLLSERMRRNELDVLADNAQVVNDYSASIRDQVASTIPYVDQFGDPSGSDHKQLDSIAKEAQRAQELAQSYDPQIRAAGLQQLTSASSRFDAFHSELEGRTQELADKQTALQAEVGKHYQDIVETQQGKAREINSSADQAMYLLNNNGVGAVETKSALMHLLQMSTREADQDAGTVSIAPFGLGYSVDVNDFNPTYDQAVKMIESVRQTHLKAINDYVSQTVQQAQKQGYAFSATDDGKVSVNNINTVVQDFRQQQPKGAPSVDPRADNPVSTAVSDVIESATGPQNSAELDAVRDFAKDKVEAAVKASREFLNKHLRNNRRRPTN